MESILKYKILQIKNVKARTFKIMFLISYSYNKLKIKNTVTIS